jgi:hypothetical protein
LLTSALLVVKHLVSFNRSPTWITPEFAAEFAPEGRETAISAQQKGQWSKNPKVYQEYRKSIESSMNRFFDVQYSDGESQKVAFQAMTQAMTDRLKTKPELAKVLIPTFAFGCRR